MSMMASKATTSANSIVTEAPARSTYCGQPVKACQVLRRRLQGHDSVMTRDAFGPCTLAGVLTENSHGTCAAGPRRSAQARPCVLRRAPELRMSMADVCRHYCQARERRQRESAQHHRRSSWPSSNTCSSTRHYRYVLFRKQEATECMARDRSARICSAGRAPPQMVHEEPQVQRRQHCRHDACHLPTTR